MHKCFSITHITALLFQVTPAEVGNCQRAVSLNNNLNESEVTFGLDNINTYKLYNRTVKLALHLGIWYRN
jgi:hypothetical protein